MLSLLIDPEELLEDGELQLQTRQSRRELVRNKIKDSERRRKFNQSAAATPALSKEGKAKAAHKAKRREQRQRKISFRDHCYQVADMISRIAVDLESNGVDEEKQWLKGHDGLVDALARDHQVVNKYRPAGSSVTHYERRVINGALAICELDLIVQVEKQLGYHRLRPLGEAGFNHPSFTRLRAA